MLREDLHHLQKWMCDSDGLQPSDVGINRRSVGRPSLSAKGNLHYLQKWIAWLFGDQPEECERLLPFYRDDTHIFMQWHKDTIEVNTRGKGLYPFTASINERIRSWGIDEGMCFLYVQHTSASMLISENYDPTARMDLETFMDRLAPENQSWHRHTLEGSDDSPSHLRSMLTDTSLSIPIDDGQLNMGTWQGVYLFEHRVRGHRRRVLLRCLG
ncbi:MAG: secondary thiamine-phosphate synthase enzyme YjbQ [Chloroflexota bacterium]|nr:secondary thiamine-phosphate synthase enzyme YjbQ [Chloroflexota bacterium]